LRIFSVVGLRSASLCEYDGYISKAHQTLEHIMGRIAFASDEILAERAEALDRTTSVERLTELSRSKDTITVSGVAANRITPHQLLAKLAKHKNWGVRSAVARNWSAHIDTVLLLCKDENQWVRDFAEQNPGRRYS
jgi:hypothetical protein